MPLPFVHASIGQNRGGVLFAGQWYLHVMTIIDQRIPHGRAISTLSLAVWWEKLDKSYKVRHNMTQIANILAVAAVSIGLWTLLSIVDSQRRGGLYTRGGVIAILNNSKAEIIPRSAVKSVYNTTLYHALRCVSSLITPHTLLHYILHLVVKNSLIAEYFCILQAWCNIKCQNFMKQSVRFIYTNHASKALIA